MSGRRSALTIATALVAATALALGGCGGGDDGADEQAPAPEPTTEASRCAPVPRPALASIEATLKGDRRLGRSAGVQSTDSFGGPRGLSEGAWFVTADVLPNPGLSTWMMDERHYRTGGGTLVGVSASARTVSSAGDLLDLGVIGVEGGSDGYAESAACV